LEGYRRSVTQHFPTRQLRFFLTAPSPCPYLPGREERKVFAHLPLLDGATVNDSLTQGGFRRSQNIAYRPACEQCSACVSARIPVSNYAFSKSERRALSRNDGLKRHVVEAEATLEQFELLRRYLTARATRAAAWPTWVGRTSSPWSKIPPCARTSWNTAPHRPTTVLAT
jgi:arginine-tRNA-protein transferase